MQNTLENCFNTLVLKGKEYQRNDNPFHVYDTLRAFSPSLSREEIIWGMAAKHFVSIINIREDVKAGNIPTEEMIDEKYGDLINYLLIEKTSILDKLKQKACL